MHEYNKPCHVTVPKHKQCIVVGRSGQWIIIICFLFEPTTRIEQLLYQPEKNRRGQRVGTEIKQVQEHDLTRSNNTLHETRRMLAVGRRMPSGQMT